MSKLDFQNGFALGLAGKREFVNDNEIMVTFVKGKEPYTTTYEKVIIRNGNAVDEPIQFNHGKVGGWYDRDGNIITFPFFPTYHTTLYGSGGGGGGGDSDEVWVYFRVDKDTYPYAILDANQTGAYYSLGASFFSSYEFVEGIGDAKGEFILRATSDVINYYRSIKFLAVEQETVREARTFIEFLKSIELSLWNVDKFTYDDTSEWTTFHGVFQTTDCRYTNFKIPASCIGPKEWHKKYRFDIWGVTK